jgi:hypothetical protein
MIDYDTESAKKLAKNVFTIEEFFKMRLQKVKFMQNNFLRRKTIKIHGHCHQKSLSTMEATFDVECTEKQFGYYLQFGLLWNGRFFGYEKNIMKSVCKWVKIPYSQN